MTRHRNDDAVFRAMNDVDFPVAKVLAGIDAAAEAGLPVKVNTVVKRGANEGSILELARHFRGTPHTLRFIEYMDVGATNGWRLDDVVPAAEIVAAIDAEFPLEPLEANYRGEVARRFRYQDGAGEIGVIASVTQPFCGDCTRARLSAEGRIFTCLFGLKGHDLRAALRDGTSDDGLRELEDRALVGAALDDRVHLHGQAGFRGRVDPGEHLRDREVDVVHRAEGLVVERVEADRDPAQPGVGEQLRLLRQQRPVRRQRQVDLTASTPPSPRSTTTS